MIHFLSSFKIKKTLILNRMKAKTFITTYLICTEIKQFDTYPYNGGIRQTVLIKQRSSLQLRSDLLSSIQEVILYTPGSHYPGLTEAFPDKVLSPSQFFVFLYISILFATCQPPNVILSYTGLLSIPLYPFPENSRT